MALTCNRQTQSGCGWIGLYQYPTNLGSMVGWVNWASGCASSYRDWYPGEPNDYTGDENCAFLGWHGSGQWLDAPCEMRAQCVCEMGLTATGNPIPLPGSSPPSSCNVLRGCVSILGNCVCPFAQGTSSPPPAPQPPAPALDDGGGGAIFVWIIVILLLLCAAGAFYTR
eukprot:4496797-Prymnesium_polylepis.1